MNLSTSTTNGVEGIPRGFGGEARTSVGSSNRPSKKGTGGPDGGALEDEDDDGGVVEDEPEESEELDI
jgi:hypothetical protein